tara:strand:- start:8 stop:385 length:378 start_codon:yes stop_codon:yes gene_type:complete
MSKRIIITLSICLAFVLSSNAQSQLTFNQVLLVPLTSQGDTVPQGKVWKVESSVSELTNSGETSFFVNNNKCTVTKSITYLDTYNDIGYTSTIVNPIFPMWLPAGTIVTSGDLLSALSIIEFNIE